MHNHIDNHFCLIWCIDHDLDWLIIYYFHKPVDDNQYQVIAITLLVSWAWEAYNKVYWQVFPSMCSNGQRLKISIWLVANCLWCQTNITALNVIEQLSRRWGLDIGRTAPIISSSECSFPRRSIPTLKLIRIAIGVGSLYSWLGGSFLPQHSAGGIETRYQQLH